MRAGDVIHLEVIFLVYMKVLDLNPVLWGLVVVVEGSRFERDSKLMNESLIRNWIFS